MQMFVSMFFTSDSPQDDISDSETEDLAGLRIDDWLVFQMDKEVREHWGPFKLPCISNRLSPSATHHAQIQNVLHLQM